MITKDSVTNDPFSLEPTHQTDPKATLPFNLESGFGGVDATLAMFDEAAIRTGLFDFGTGGSTRVVQWRSRDMSMDQQAQATIRVPDCLNFNWSSGDKSMTMAGETKASFQRKLVESASAGLSIGGFGMEFQRTFKEDHFEETFEKYVAYYERAMVYTVEFNDDPQKFLSARAQTDFGTLSPAAIVNKYGTHYMQSAIFGGVKIFSSRLDIRDEVTETELSTALSISVKETDPDTGQTDSGKGGYGNSDTRIQKLHQAMSVSMAETIGGTEGDHPHDWVNSLYTNPSVIGYKLQPISDLIADARIADAVAAECAKRFEAQQITNSHSLLAMMSPINAYTSDRGSHAHADLSVGRPQDVPGWYYTGQWGLPFAGGFPRGYQALIFRAVPGAPGEPAIKSCTGVTLKWTEPMTRGMGMDFNLPFGLYAPVAPSGYVAIGDLYESTGNPAAVPNLDFYGCIRSDLVVPTTWDPQPLWTDRGSGSKQDGSAFSFENYDRRDTPDDQREILVPSGASEARMFKVTSGYSQPAYTPVKLRPDVVRVLTNRFLF